MILRYLRSYLGPVIAGRSRRIFRQYSRRSRLLVPSSVLLAALSVAKLGNNEEISSVNILNSDDLPNVIDKVQRSVVQLKLELHTSDELQKKNLVSSGSGFIIRSDGLILTSAHLVLDLSQKSKITIKFWDGEVRRGELYCIDPMSDLALIKPVDSLNREGTFEYPVVALKEKSGVCLRVGQRIFAVGSPFGLTNTVTAGIISALNRTDTNVQARQDSRIKYLQTDLHLFPGNSGGPICDYQGRVIGVCTTKGPDNGLSFAMQWTSIEKLVDQMIKRGKVYRPWLGFRAVSLNPEIVHQIENLSHQSAFHDLHHGVLVLKSFPDSPAAIAGLKPGDVVIAADNQPITDLADLLNILDGKPVGEQVKLEVKRIKMGDDRLHPSVQVFYCHLRPSDYDYFTHKDLPYN